MLIFECDQPKVRNNSSLSPAKRDEPVFRDRVTLYLLLLGLVCALPLLTTSPVLASSVGSTPFAARGYASRACGLDLDDDNVLGEPEDDCRVCDGVTADPDGDGINEDILYIDCDSGNDQPGCGSAGSPCKTISHAWNTIADGPGDGAEDILCFKGTCTPDAAQIPGVSGVAGTRTRPATGSEARDWRFPSNPTMLIGWDADRDGDYPPHDTDDIAVLDGGGNTPLAIEMNTGSTGPVSYVEMAHFTARDYRTDISENAGFIDFGQGASGSSDYIYLHDLSLRNINKDSPKFSNVIAFGAFSGGTVLDYVAVINVELTDFGGYMSRGGLGGSIDNVSGPIRFQNLTATMHGCDFGACAASEASITLIKYWNYISGIEFLDSKVDGQLSDWNPNPTGGPAGTLGINPAQCSQDWIIRNNHWTDLKIVLAPTISESYCSTRSIDDVVFDANTVEMSSDYFAFVIVVDCNGGGSSASSTVEDLTISNNLVWIESPDYLAAVRDYCGNSGQPQPGTTTIIGNTFHGQPRLSTTAHIVVGGSSNFRKQSFDIKNNIFDGIGNGNNIYTAYAPSNWNADFNVFDPNGDFHWNGAAGTNLAQWRSNTGGDTNSSRCEPRYQDEPNGDLHLLSSDSCAQDEGTAIPNLNYDIDSDSRSQGSGWDIGADELVVEIFGDGFESGDTSSWP